MPDNVEVSEDFLVAHLPQAHDFSIHLKVEAIGGFSVFLLILHHQLPRVSTRGLMEQSESMPLESYFALRIVGHTDAKSEAM